MIGKLIEEDLAKWSNLYKKLKLTVFRGIISNPYFAFVLKNIKVIFFKIFLKRDLKIIFLKI
jgi:hypothetical protein